MLDMIARTTGAKFVISSFWRIAEHRTNEWWNDLFRKYGAKHIEVIGRTDWITSVARGVEINKWIVDNAFTGQYIIIDDSSDFTESQRSRHVHVAPHIGMQYVDLLQALLLLAPDDVNADVWADMREQALKQMAIVGNQSIRQYRGIN